MSGYKKNSMTYQQGTLGVCYRLICTNFGDGFLCTLSPNHNIHRENGVYHWWTTYTLKSRSVSEIHFPAFWRYKFTDFKNSKKKLNLWEKNGCRQKCLDKSLHKNDLIIFSIQTQNGCTRCIHEGKNLRNKQFLILFKEELVLFWCFFKKN